MEPMDDAAGPLDGVRVLELGSFIAGPFAGQLLGDLGAEVIKVEPPGRGDPMRAWGVCDDEGRSYWWPAIARNKKSVVVDLRTPGGAEVVRRIAVTCDVVLENFTPGRLTAWGLDHATLAAQSPRLITTHVSGFGQTGPRADDPGFGSIGEAMGGVRHVTGWPDRPSTRAGISLGDALASLFAVVGTLAALHERERSGRGQEVDVALYEAVFAVMESLIADHELGGALRGRTGPVLPGIAPSNVYPTADGHVVLIAGNADPIFVRLCAAMGRPDLAHDDRYATHHARGERVDEVDALVSAWTARLTRAEVEATLRAHGVPHGPVHTAADIVDDPQYAARNMIRRLRSPFLDDDVPMPGVVPRLTRTPGTIRSTGPMLGQHTRLVLADIAGYHPDEIDVLVASGVVAVEPSD